MRLISFELNERMSFGAVTSDGSRVINLSRRFPDVRDLKSLLSRPAWQQEVATLSDDDADLTFDDLVLLPVIPNPDKIFCVGINYASHVIETGREMPAKPMIFTRVASSQVGHRGDIIRPLVSERLDFEGELAVIIGNGGRYISKQSALDHVAGYSCYNDGSIRDWQRHTIQFTPGKNFPETGGFGPWLVTKDEVGQIESQRIVTRLNGTVMQDGRLDDLIFDVPALISYCSYFTELLPGDVIVTGTTGGVGAFREPPIWMRDGDTVEVEIDGIGLLKNQVRDEQATPDFPNEWA